jgi:hypothetical protein
MNDYSIFRMSISLISNWLVGVINGYSSKENGLPASIKYTTISLASMISGFKMIEPKMPPSIVLTSFFIISPLMVGSLFCIGTQMGKGIRYIEDRPTAGSKIKML